MPPFRLHYEPARRDDADALVALRGSDANRFYQRHGFVQTGESAFDLYYERAPRPASS